jgi:hypothetical protein
MDIEFLHKTTDSAVENCPAAYRVTSAEGGYVIQGYELDADTRAKLRHLDAGEGAVHVPADVIDRIRAAGRRPRWRPWR